MADDRCDRIHEDLSAYVDGTLSSKRHDQVRSHVSECADCRDEVSALSSVCSTLSACRGSGAPRSLAARLESIAGEQASAPLYMARGAGALPTSRQRRIRSVAYGGVALVAVVVSTMVLAVLVAPEPLRLTDPVRSAREQYSMSMSAISVSEAVGAVLLSIERGANLGEPSEYVPRDADARGVDITPRTAAALLRSAADADLTLTGVQTVWVSDGEGGYRTADVRTAKLRGHGARLDVLDANGDRFSSSFLPDFDGRPTKAPDDWRYVRSAETHRIAGREAIHVEAHRDQSPVAGWWIDDETGLLLWAERYDDSGEVSLAVGYQDLSLGSASLGDENLTQLITLEPATSSQSEGWCVGLRHCPQEAGGLPLVAYASSERAGRTTMNLVYSDGLDFAVVGWTPGVLGDGVTARTDQAAGMPAVEVWQAGEAVVSVASNADPETLAAIAEQLPEEQPYQRSLGQRVSAGFARMVGVD